MLCDQEAEMFMSLESGASAMSVTIVWKQLKVFEVIDNEAYDYLLKNGFLRHRDMNTIKAEYDSETSKRIAALHHCYTDPKNVFSVTHLVGGKLTEYHAFHYACTNMSLENTGSLERTLFVSPDRISDPKKQWYEYEKLDAIILSGMLYYSMSWLQKKNNEDDFDGAVDNLILMGPMITLCKSATIHFVLYYCNQNRCDIFTGDLKSFKSEFRCRYDITIDPFLWTKATLSLEMFCTTRKFYFNPKDGFARAIHNRKSLKVNNELSEDQRIYNALTHDETTKWTLALGAKNSPQALQNLNVTTPNTRRQNRNLTSAVTTMATTTQPATVNVIEPIMQSLLTLEKNNSARLKKELEMMEKNLTKQTKKLEDLKKFEAANIQNEQTILDLKTKNDNLRKQLKDKTDQAKRAVSESVPIKAAKDSAVTNKEIISYSTVSLPCPIENEIQLAEKRRKLEENNLKVQELQLRIQQRQIQADDIARMSHLKNMAVQQQTYELQLASKNRTLDLEEEAKKRRWKLVDEDRSDEREEKKLHNAHRRKVELIEVGTDSKMNLVRVSQENSLMYSLVHSNQRQMHSSVNEGCSSSSSSGSSSSNSYVHSSNSNSHHNSHGSSISGSSGSSSSNMNMSSTSCDETKYFMETNRSESNYDIDIARSTATIKQLEQEMKELQERVSDSNCDNYEC